MAKRSAGLLLYRWGADGIEVLIAHPGGPFWTRKDDGAWSIPKGEHPDGEDPWDTARREFAEEIGLDPPDGERLDLGVVRQAGGKLVTVFAVHGDLDVSGARSNTFEMEWPPRSGQLREFPEVDRVGWFTVALARTKLLAGQRPVLDRLVAGVGTGP
ncbi:NUDIX domain-containing protein [Mycolicibacter senuensis]|uniref:Phosphohydrolase n=1 Tax=Mycolicibacter senuensis TaxID=386913 RepID=A0A7I9XMI2_9MYCO|nr:NUDIX domain-containing protein [Mycolicibacter senuensis]MDQ2626259.1 NUDIX domain-containing protein [Actinomycetota bacterium]ORW66315.1 NTP pyrophosphohydrolase [Mycolicibacter senuensis]GFG71144.1 phosphohydrolase [Mycolicibacter senuensis]